MRTRHGAMAVASVLVLAGLSPGAGTILTDGAVLEAGTGGDEGTVTVDPAAPGTPPSLPSAGTPGAPPAMTGSMPAFPGAGNGSDGSLTVSADLALAGGTYQYGSLLIENLATLSFDGPVTLLVQGDVTIYGFLVTTADASPITIRCGGRFQLLSDSGATPAVETTGSAGPVSIAAAKGLDVGSGLAGGFARVRAAGGAVDLQANGTVVGERGLSVVSGEVKALNGTVTLRSAAEVQIGGSNPSTPGAVDAGGGPVLVQSFGADLSVSAFGQVDALDGQPHTFESAGALQFNGRTNGGGASSIAFRAVTGPLVMGGTTYSISGNLLFHSGTSITVTGDDEEIAQYNTGSVVFEAVGGDISFGGPDCRVDAGGATVAVTAAGAVRFADNYAITCNNLVVRAQGGDLTMEGAPHLSTYGPLVLRASDQVYIGVPPEPGLLDRGTPRLRAPDLVSTGSAASLEGDSVEIAAGPGGVILDAEHAYARNGDFTVLAGGPVAVAQTVSAEDDIRIASLLGDVDVEQATLETDDRSEVDSGSVTVETWLPTGTIAADGAVIRSGDTDATSGDVALLVHTDGIAPPAIESFVLPKKIKVKLNAADDGRSSLVAAGFLDTGPDAEPSLDAAATVTLGEMEIPVAGLVPDAKGTKFSYAGSGLLFQVKTAKTGSSKAVFRVKYRGGLAGQVDPEEAVALSFDNGTVDGTGVVGLQAGAYTLGRKRGALVSPNLYLYAAKAALQGDGKDALSIKAGLATGGTTPETAPSVTVGFGGTFSRTIPTGSFVPNGDRFEFRGNEGGITLVILDYLKETVTVKGRGLDLGTFAGGAVPVVVTVGIGGDSRAVRVRMGRKGSSLVY